MRIQIQGMRVEKIQNILVPFTYHLEYANTNTNTNKNAKTGSHTNKKKAQKNKYMSPIFCPCRKYEYKYRKGGEKIGQNI